MNTADTSMGICRTTITPGKVWPDTSGKTIQAHGGGILLHKGVYYWYGENKDAENCRSTENSDLLTRVNVIGVNCYSSKNLVDWKYEGLVLAAEKNKPGHDLHPSCVLERPKVLYNRKYKKFVMWMHIDSADYTKACTGVAISDSPTGPFEYLQSFRPNNYESRDFTVFQDEDEKAYLIHSSDWNSVMIVADLQDDYLGTTGCFSRHFDSKAKNTGRESPAVFKHEGKYFIITSGTTGWSPNAAEYAVADSIHGPWKTLGNPCIGQDSEVTFNSQNTFVLPAPERPGEFIFMADRWKRFNLRDSRYVWLPFIIENGRIELHWKDRWEPGLDQ